MLLMFGVGLHFSFDDLLAVRRIALPGALAQIVVATALGAAVARLWGWSLGAGIVFGLALSVASTVVLLRALEGRGRPRVAERPHRGRLARRRGPGDGPRAGAAAAARRAGSAAAPAAPAPAAEAACSTTLGADRSARVAAFVALMLVVGRRLFPWFLWQVARTGSRELFTLCVIAAAVGIAYGSAELFGVSFALGAFFAGMVMRESDLSHRAAAESLPLRDAFSVLFFVSVGMLFDPAGAAPRAAPRR